MDIAGKRLRIECNKCDRQFNVDVVGLGQDKEDGVVQFGADLRHVCGTDLSAEEIALDVLWMAFTGGMPDTYWHTDERIKRACDVLGITPVEARELAEKKHDDHWSDDEKPRGGSHLRSV